MRNLMNRNNIYVGLGLCGLLLAGCKQPTDRSVFAYQAEPVKLQLEKGETVILLLAIQLSL